MDFEQIIIKYQKLIYNTARRLMGNNEDAEDAAQEVAIKIYKNLASCRGEEFLPGWISKITHNTCMDVLRRRKGKHHDSLDDIVEFGDGSGGVQKQLADDEKGPEDLLLQKEVNEQIEGALLKLSMQFRPLVILRDIQGHSYEEISDILNMPVGTVKSRLFRGRSKLKSILLKETKLEQKKNGQRQLSRGEADE
ncbi:MAG: sigma-70 family RNA polymerase sigma factor [Defluviitaleaceae bacterium]|nr:sigma-70 family RNA polymerase sigma factor [Defluviitaleaceae bacterium]